MAAKGQDPMTTKCPYCQTQTSRFFTTRDWNRKISDSQFLYYRCPACRLIFLHPIPENLGDYYPQNYYPVPATLADLEAASENERFKLDLITRFIRKGRLLEVGPAFGNFAYIAKRSGFDVEVIEMDARCCSFLQNVAGIKTIQSRDAVEAIRARGSYDIITLWHVIEHLPDTWTTLAAISESLPPGGFLVIAAPNPRAFQFRVLGRYWPHVDAPRHVILISLSLLSKHLKSLGLETVWTTTTDKGSLGWNLFGWQYFFTNFVNAHDGSFLKRGLRFVGKIVSKLAGPVERRDGLGSAYTAVFRKEE